MTAPRAEPHAQPMEMFMRYPTGHEHEGQRVSRQQTCGCGTKFYQGRLSPDWLDRMPAHQSASFVTTATQVERKDGSVWLPKACPHCERREMNTPPQKELAT